MMTLPACADVEFVGEYAPYDMYALENIARAVELFPHSAYHLFTSRLDCRD